MSRGVFRCREHGDAQVGEQAGGRSAEAHRSGYRKDIVTLPLPWLLNEEMHAKIFG